MTTLPSSDEAICERIGSAGLITLNRPQALNALTLGMVRTIAAALDTWETDSAVTRVVIRGAGEKAFCAGGDIRRIHDLGRAGKPEEPLAFWREEYALNIRIKRYPKPYVALMDGIVMGGGVGMSCTAVTVSPVTALFSPCRKSASASSPMSARHTLCHACRARQDCGWR